MELPLGGPALRHYTQSRPRPHRQKLNYRPSRPQETIIESENEVLELMGRVDEGVEEFFTKRVLPTDPLKKQDEESITVHEVAPASSVPCPPPTKTLRRKLGDFFTLKKRRGLKSETSHEGRPKKGSIADLIRPLREVARAEKEKDKDRVKEPDRENDKEKAKEYSSVVTGDSAAQETPASCAPALRGEAVPPRRALREGKSQSLILLSGSAAAGTTNARNTAKKQFEGQHSFEQKLHLMLQRIGVSKQPQGEMQNQEGEMKKAESEGTIIDSKPEPPPTFSKPRTMSASSDTRHQIRPSVSAHESAGKPALLPKPVIKPAPPPTTSGRNTPENELAEIQEGETNKPTTLSPAAATSPPVASTLTATTMETVLTISNSIPDSASLKISPSSTVTLSDTDICTDSVKPTAVATTPTNVIELDSKASVLEASATTTELTTATLQTTLTSGTTPLEPPTTVSITSTSFESITLTPSVTSNSTTIVKPSINTSETVSAPSNESKVFTTSTNLSTKLTLPETDGILSVDVTPPAGGNIALSVTTACTTCTSISNMLSGLCTTPNSITQGSDDSTSVSSTSYSTLVSSVTETTSLPSNLSDNITATVLLDTHITTSSSLISATLSPTSSTSMSATTTTTTTATSIAFINSVSVSTITHTATSNPVDLCVPSTSSSETAPTGTTSTANSLNCADTTSTTSSAMTAAVSSTLSINSEPDNISTSLPTPTGIHATDNTTTSHLTNSTQSNESPGQDNNLQTSFEERSSTEPAEKATAADDELEMVQNSKQTEIGKKKSFVDGGKRSETEKPMMVCSKETKIEVQEESVNAEEDTKEELPSGKENE